MGNTIDVFMGDSRGLRDRIGNILPKWDKEHPLYSFLLGMYAFGLEECHEYERAEEVGYEGIALNPKVVWALHSLAHGLLMQGKNSEGANVMDENVENWDNGNFFSSHLAIHNILFRLEQDDLDNAIKLYDNNVFNENSPPIILTMIDASSALWRFYLEEVDVGKRLEVLSESWKDKAGQAHHAFNDMHAMMAFVAAGDESASDQLITTLESFIEDKSNERYGNYKVTKEIGLPICNALRDFGQGNYNNVIEILSPIEDQVYRVGGSHAQRDVVSRTLLEASLRAKKIPLAKSLLAGRLTALPDSTYNLQKKAQLEVLLD